MNILIVEDAADQRLILESILKKYGHTVHVTENGQQALEILHSNSNIQLVLSDWMMPEMDGLELCKRIRHAKFSRYIYFILLTGISDDNAVIEGMNIGADDFLKKPVNFRELEARLKAGIRVLELEKHLADKNRQLKYALDTIERDLEAAASSLLSLLPIPQKLLQTAFFWRFQPSRILGGDMLGYQALDDEHIAFYQIDVSGHGIPSALFSFSLNHLLSDINPDSSLLLQTNREKTESTCEQGQPFQGIRSPEKVLGLLNERFQSSTKNMMYFTIAYGVIHTGSGLLKIAHAGHPASIRVGANGELTSFRKGGTPIGFVPDFSYESEMIQLSPGDSVLCHTDGLTESMDNTQQIFGEKRLHAILKEHATSTPDHLLDHILNKIIAWQGSPNFKDDLSCLYIKWKPHENTTIRE